MLYARKFFKTEKAAKTFQQKNGGALYSNAPNSQTADYYHVEACLVGLTEAQKKARPYCVVWNVVDEGPIQPDMLPEVTDRAGS